MRFTIWGAGAIGGTLGASLVKSGQNVLFVDKVADHVDEMNANGLEVTGATAFQVPVAAALPGDVQGPLEVVLLAVKSQHTDEALSQLTPLLGPDSVVVSLQNGLNEEKIAAAIGAENTIGAFIHWGADYLSPGRVLFGHGASFYLGELDGRITTRLKDFQEIFSVFLPVELTDNIFGYLWCKQVVGSLLFATALADLSVGEVVVLPQARAILGDLVREAMAVPKALGIRLEQFGEFDLALFDNRQEATVFDAMVARSKDKIKNKTGVWRDIAVRKRPTEVDFIVGETVRRGETLGLNMTLNRRLVDIIHELERGERTMNENNFVDLAG